MKLLRITPLILAITFFSYSCQNDKDESSNNASEENLKSTEVSTKSFEKLAVNPCNLIDEAMVTKHFDVSAEELEKDEYVKEKISSYAHCTYEWEKEDIEAIKERNQKKLMAAVKSGNTGNAIKVGREIEQTHKFVGVTNLKLYEDQEKARTYFENSHKKPSKKDLEKLDEEFKKQADKKELSENQKEVGKDVGSGIADNLKFQKIENLGDYAYWDDLGLKVDVLVGKIQFGVKIHTGEGTEKDIEMATIIAKEILSKL